MERFAVYFCPAREHPLSRFGRSWLGWDPETGQNHTQPTTTGLTATAWERAVEAPRKYGFHGTLKPPMRLIEGETPETLTEALIQFARATQGFDLGCLVLKRIGRFLALVPEFPSTELADLAADCVKNLDRFRLAPSEDELIRRRKAGLTVRQESYLLQWGYPYVLEEFRFHLTLTSGLQDEELHALEAILDPMLAGILQYPVRVEDICLFGDPGNGDGFRLLRRFSLATETP